VFFRVLLVGFSLFRPGAARAPRYYTFREIYIYKEKEIGRVNNSK